MTALIDYAGRHDNAHNPLQALLLLGRSGPVNALIAQLLGAAAGSGGGPALDDYSMWGMILIEGIGFVPLTFLLMSAT